MSRLILLLSALCWTSCAHRAPPAAESPPAVTAHGKGCQCKHAEKAHGHGEAGAGSCQHGGPSHHGEGHRSATVHHRFDDAEKWAARFEDPKRDEWQRPDQVLGALALAPDARVADLGSATGYFSVRLARAVPRGTVFGVDIEPDMARYLEERARREGLANLVSVLGAPNDPKLPEPVDLVLVVDTYHHLGDRTAYFRALKERLRPGGRVAVVDFKKGSPRGPPDEMKLSPEQVREELSAAGFRQLASHDFLPDQYFLVFGT